MIGIFFLTQAAQWQTSFSKVATLDDRKVRNVAIDNYINLQIVKTFEENIQGLIVTL